MSEDKKQASPLKNALKRLSPDEPQPAAPVEETASIAKLFHAAGPAAATTVIAGTGRVKSIKVTDRGLAVHTSDPDDVWVTSWHNVIWYRPTR